MHHLAGRRRGQVLIFGQAFQPVHAEQLGFLQFQGGARPQAPLFGAQGFQFVAGERAPSVAARARR